MKSMIRATAGVLWAGALGGCVVYPYDGYYAPTGYYYNQSYYPPGYPSGYYYARPYPVYYQTPYRYYYQRHYRVR